MAKTKIEWCDYTVNPFIGCKHGCFYCYAERMNKRFKFVKTWALPEYQAGWQEKIDKIRKPSIIFMGSMTDLFGEWVTDEFITEMLYTCGLYTEHTFLFLTKNPKRYADFAFPSNCWRGATITNRETVKNVKYVDFVSVEPLMEDLGIYHFGNIKWMIVGGMTPKPVHKEQWVKNLISWADRFGVPIFLKDNLHYPKQIKEFSRELKQQKEQIEQ